MKQPRKIYASVTEFERQTSYCPMYLAWRIVDEARDYFRTELIPSPVPRRRDILSHPMGEELANKLARRAEAVFAHQPFWQRKYQSARGREYILMSMRHWLAGVLARERPALFRALPESFKVGLELLEKQPGGAAETVSKVFIGWGQRQRRTRLAELDSARLPRPIASATTARVDFGFRQRALTRESPFSGS